MVERGTVVAEGTSEVDGNYAGGVGYHAGGGEDLGGKLPDGGITDNQLNNDGNKQEKATNDEPTNTISGGVRHHGAEGIWKWGKKNKIKKHHSEHPKLNKRDHPKVINGLKKSFKKEINGLKKTFKKLMKQHKRKNDKKKTR